MAPPRKAELAAQVEALQKSLDQALAKSARLEESLTEALDQQVAAGEILDVIARSPTDLQPMFDAMAERAATLCAAAFAGVHLFDGQLITYDAQHGLAAEPVEFLRTQVFPLRPGRGSAVGRAILERAVAHIHDIREDPD